MAEKTTTRQQIEWKIFNSDDILDLLEIIGKEHSKEVVQYKANVEEMLASKGYTVGLREPNTTITIELPDQSKFETSDIEVAKEFVKKEKIISISAWFRTDDKMIDIGLSHGPSYFSKGLIEISGEDSIWVQGVTTHLKNRLTYCQNQYNIFSKYWYIFFIIILVSIVFFISQLGLRFFDFIIPPVETLNMSANAYEEKKSDFYSLLYALLCIVAAFPSYYIVNKLMGLFPVIEINTGPDYLHTEKLGRKKIISLLIVIGIPTTFFILSIILMYI